MRLIERISDLIRITGLCLLCAQLCHKLEENSSWEISYCLEFIYLCVKPSHES